MASRPPILRLPIELLHQILCTYDISSSERKELRSVHRAFATILAPQTFHTITIATQYLTADLWDLLSEQVRNFVSFKDLDHLRSSAQVLRISNNPAIEAKSRYSKNALHSLISVLPKLKSIELVFEDVLETPFLMSLMNDLNKIAQARGLPVDARITKLGTSSKSYDPTIRSEFIAALPPLRTLDIKGGFWPFETGQVLAVELSHTIQRSPDITTLSVQDDLRRRQSIPSLELILDAIWDENGLQKLNKLVLEIDSFLHYETPRHARRIRPFTWSKLKNLKELE